MLWHYYKASPSNSLASTTKIEISHMGTTTASFLLRLLLVVGFVCLLLFGSLGCGEARKLKHGDEIGRDSQAELDFNYMSKRRVPNGPDPIHNRRAGNSGRPPGRA